MISEETILKRLMHPKKRLKRALKLREIFRQILKNREQD